MVLHAFLNRIRSQNGKGVELLCAFDEAYQMRRELFEMNHPGLTNHADAKRVCSWYATNMFCNAYIMLNYASIYAYIILKYAKKFLLQRFYYAQIPTI